MKPITWGKKAEKRLAKGRLRAQRPPNRKRLREEAKEREKEFEEVKQTSRRWRKPVFCVGDNVSLGCRNGGRHTKVIIKGQKRLRRREKGTKGRELIERETRRNIAPKIEPDGAYSN